MEKIINQSQIKQNLPVASLFLASFELLKTTIEDRIKGFLCNVKIKENGKIEYIMSQDYKSEVIERKIPKLDRRKYKEYHLFYSSCLWLKDMNAIDEKDVDDLKKIRKQRNDIAHNLVNLLIDDDTNINLDLLKKTQDLLIKIEKWWIVEVELPDPYYMKFEIDENNIQTGLPILLDYLIMIAFTEESAMKSA